jgi:hypothetical protein
MKVLMLQGLLLEALEIVLDVFIIRKNPLVTIFYKGEFNMRSPKAKHKET